MAVIKEIIIEKIRQREHGTFQPEDISDENVRKELVKYVRAVCSALPGVNDPDKNPEGEEFKKIMFRTYQDLHDAAVNKIAEMLMEGSDGFADCKHLHQKLLKAITRSWRELFDAVTYKDLIDTKVIQTTNVK